MIIDAHQHFWQLKRGDYNWLKPHMSALYRDFMPDDLRPHLEACHISGTVVVQAAPTVEETAFLLDLAEAEPFIKGVVGWLDFESKTFERDYQRFRKRAKFVGVRPMLQDLPKDDWILQDVVMERVKLLAADAFPIDILVFPRHLPYIIKLLECVPNLRGVIDHLAKPDILHQAIEPWRSYMSEIATYQNVFCKLSGMVTEADHEHWTVRDFMPYVAHVLRVFGAKRLMFGSDWPVCREAATYEEVYDLAGKLLAAQATQEECGYVFGRTAIEFYNLGVRL